MAGREPASGKPTGSRSGCCDKPDFRGRRKSVVPVAPGRPQVSAGGRELRAFVSLKMADDEMDGAERMDVSPEPPLAPRRPASVSLHRLAPFVLSTNSWPPRRGGFGAALSMAALGKWRARMEGPTLPPPIKLVVSYTHPCQPNLRSLMAVIY